MRVLLFSSSLPHVLLIRQKPASRSILFSALCAALVVFSLPDSPMLHVALYLVCWFSPSLSLLTQLHFYFIPFPLLIVSPQPLLHCLPTPRGPFNIFNSYVFYISQRAQQLPFATWLFRLHKSAWAQLKTYFFNLLRQVGSTILNK